MYKDWEEALKEKEALLNNLNPDILNLRTEHFFIQFQFGLYVQ